VLYMRRPRKCADFFAVCSVRGISVAKSVDRAVVVDATMEQIQALLFGLSQIGIGVAVFGGGILGS